MALRTWIGEREAAGKVSLYRGPLLLAYDRRFNALDPDDLPALDPDRLDADRDAWWPVAGALAAAEVAGRRWPASCACATSPPPARRARLTSPGCRWQNKCAPAVVCAHRPP